MRGLLGRIPGAVVVWWRALRRRGPRELAAVIRPWASLTVGFLIAAASVLPNSVFLETVRVRGEVGPFGSNATLFSYSGYNYVEIAFEEFPSCAIRLFVLDPRRADDYNATSTLPSPDNSLHCGRLRASFQGSIALLVIINRYNGTENYSARIDLFSVSQPYLLASIPGIVLLAYGGVTIVVGRLRGAIVRFADEYSDALRERKEKR